MSAYTTSPYRYNSQLAYSQHSPHRQPPYHSAPATSMPTYYIGRSSSRSGSGHHPPVIYQTHSGQQYHPSSRDYAYSDGGRRRRSSSVGHGGRSGSSYYPPSARSHHSNLPTEYSHSTSGHRRSNSSSRPVIIETSHRRSGSRSSRRPSVSYVCPVFVPFFDSLI
jgi:hypothetical protein